jgi:hypothetical protein
LNNVIRRNISNRKNATSTPNPILVTASYVPKYSFGIMKRTNTRPVAIDIMIFFQFKFRRHTIYKIGTIMAKSSIEPTTTLFGASGKILIPIVV